MRVSVRVGPVRFYGWKAFAYWLAGWLLYLSARLITWSVSRPRTAFALVGSGVAAWALLEHLVPTLLVVWAVVEVGHWWQLLAPGSFRRRVRVMAWWRSVWLYRRKWRTAMQVAELDRKNRDGVWERPRLVGVRCGPVADLVRVRGLLGQRFADWEAGAPMIAHVFGAVDYVVHRGDDRRLTLELTRGVVGRSWDREGLVERVDL